MTGGTLPGTSADREARIVLHVDMDCFYASCERLRHPELAGEPVVVGMGYEDGATHGAVATASYEAREYGVESAQAISAALERLPRAVDVADGDAEGPSAHYLPVDIEFYKSVAADVKSILHDCADTVREVSVDEAYLDVTERTAWRTVDGGRTLAEGYARHVKQRIAREVGVPASVGVAPDMATAKVASDADKPDGLVVVPPGSVQQFLAPLDVETLHGVGPVTARELRGMGVETAGDLASADPTDLTDRFGERGRELHDRARGADDRDVTPTGRPKSLSRESAFPEATTDEAGLRATLSKLAADVADRARRRGALYRTIGIKVVTPPYDVHTRAQSLSGPVDDPALVDSLAAELLAEFEGEAVRKLGVRVSNLSFADADQSSLEGWAGAAAAADGESGGGTTSADVDSEADADGDDDDTEVDSEADAQGRFRGQASLTDF